MNILMISSLYPADDVHFKNNTAVCHYFAKEWSAMGYGVRVIYLYNEYPQIFYPILKLAKNILADRIDAAILAKRMHKEYSYEKDGIKVTRIPAYKNKPRGDYSNKVIKRLVDRIYGILQDEDYQPDYILGHFILPGIRVVAALKDKYPKCTTTISLHGKEQVFRQSVHSSLSKIDYVGYRSYPIKKAFESIYGNRSYFMCMSGVPAEYITKEQRSFKKGIHRFIYVGNFMQRKHPECLVPAVAKNYPNEDFSITFIGDGNGIKTIEKEIARFKVEQNVEFTGRLSRIEVTNRMDVADVFIMISEKETFGLVYLEAMARGCITVAALDEGMDGVIVDGENGFLCKAGDSEELCSVVAKIKSMNTEALQTMSTKAIETARKMTDHLMAEEYLKGITLKNEQQNNI